MCNGQTIMDENGQTIMDENGQTTMDENGLAEYSVGRHFRWAFESPSLIRLFRF
jgi:hypothetical protein